LDEQTELDLSLDDTFSDVLAAEDVEVDSNVNDLDDLETSVTVARRVRFKFHFQSIKKLARVYKYRYACFINSPRTCFVYETFFYVIFLLLFTYMLLCDFNYQEVKDPLTITPSNVSVLGVSRGKIANGPTNLEWILFTWILVYVIEEIQQVCWAKPAHL
jgi:hypothetical protein